MFSDKTRNNFHRSFHQVSDWHREEERTRKAAYAIAYAAHEKQKYGERMYIRHLEMVANATSPNDEDSGLPPGAMKAAALLHDAIEDTSITREKIAEAFGTQVADIVWELTARPKEADDKSRDLEFARLAGMSLPAKLIKVCDLACNMACCAVDNSPYLAGYVAAWPRYEAALAEAWPLNQKALKSIHLCLRIANEPGEGWEARSWWWGSDCDGLLYGITRN